MAHVSWVDHSLNLRKSLYNTACFYAAMIISVLGPTGV